jgi:O-succinylhomoserine sulfhydrylase
MSGGGTVVTFEVQGGKNAAFAVMNRLRLIAVSNNLGDSKSLATHPATTTHMRIGAEERVKLGITDGVIRLSVGLEDPEDLKDDLAQALAQVGVGLGQAAARAAE